MGRLYDANYCISLDEQLQHFSAVSGFQFLFMDNAFHSIPAFFVRVNLASCDRLQTNLGSRMSEIRSL